MTLISQIGVILLIAIIIIVLLRANNTLAQVSEEGEHFIDEWALKEAKKDQIRMEREALLEKKKAALAVSEEELLDEIIYEDEIVEVKEEIEPQKVVSFPEPAFERQLSILYRGKRIRVDHYPFSIGRAGDNDLILDDLCIRAKHARIEIVMGNPYLKDLGSANKISVDGKSLDEVELVDGIRFNLGNEEFLVEIQEKRALRTLQWG